MKVTEHFFTRGPRRILDAIRRHEWLTTVALFLLLLLAVAVLPRLIHEDKKKNDGFSVEGDPLDVRLAGIRFGWGNAIFDPAGKPIGERENSSSKAMVQGGLRPYEFLLEYPGRDPFYPGVPLVDAQIHASGDAKWKFFNEQKARMILVGEGAQWAVPFTLPVSIRKIVVMNFSHWVELRKVDLTLHYYTDKPQPAPYVFEEPFAPGNKKTSQDGKVTMEVLKNSSTRGLSFRLNGNAEVMEGKRVFAFDAAGARHWPSIGDKESMIPGMGSSGEDYRVASGPGVGITRITLGEPTRERIFRNVTLPKIQEDATDMAPRIKEMAERLGRKADEKVVAEKLGSESDCARVLDLLRGDQAESAWRLIKESRREFGTYSEETRGRLRATADSWQESEDIRMRSIAIQIGLRFRWPESHRGMLRLISRMRERRGPWGLRQNSDGRWLTPDEWNENGSASFMESINGQMQNALTLQQMGRGIRSMSQAGDIVGAALSNALQESFGTLGRGVMQSLMGSMRMGFFSDWEMNDESSYPLELTKEEMRNLRDAVMSMENPPLIREVVKCMQDRLNYLECRPALLDFMTHQRTEVWWRVGEALRTLMTREEIAALPREIQPRILAASSGRDDGTIPAENLNDVRKTCLGALGHADWSRDCGGGGNNLLNEMYNRVLRICDKDMATSAILQCLANKRPEPTQPYLDFIGHMVRIRQLESMIRQVNAWHSVNIGRLGARIGDFEGVGSSALDWDQITSDALAWRRTGRDPGELPQGYRPCPGDLRIVWRNLDDPEKSWIDVWRAEQGKAKPPRKQLMWVETKRDGPWIQGDFLYYAIMPETAKSGSSEIAEYRIQARYGLQGSSKDSEVTVPASSLPQRLDIAIPEKPSPSPPSSTSGWSVKVEDVSPLESGKSEISPGNSCECRWEVWLERADSRESVIADTAVFKAWRQDPREGLRYPKERFATLLFPEDCSIGWISCSENYDKKIPTKRTVR